MKIRPFQYGSLTTIKVRIRKSWHQKVTRLSIRLLTWIITRRERSLRKLRYRREELIVRQAYEPSSSIELLLRLVDANLIDREFKLLEAKKSLRQLQHMYVNLYITPFRRSQKEAG